MKTTAGLSKQQPEDENSDVDEGFFANKLMIEINLKLYNQLPCGKTFI